MGKNWDADFIWSSDEEIRRLRLENAIFKGLQNYSSLETLNLINLFSKQILNINKLDKMFLSYSKWRIFFSFM